MTASTFNNAHTFKTHANKNHLSHQIPLADLNNQYTATEGRALLSGIQALVKLPLLQHARDQLNGKNTAGFISGYRGSPLGGYDLALWKAEKHLKNHNIVFQPGLNEELAATAIWGTQQLGFSPKNTNKSEGVFGLWYGKGPGVDRCADVFKHGNMAGTTPLGGVLVVAGDDHCAKSSSLAHQSDHIFKACGLPVFFPASVQEILDLGIHAFAMSRFSGLWAGFKTIQEVVESSASVDITPNRVQIILPTDFKMPLGGLHIRWPDPALDQEERLFDYKWYAALAYIRANKLNYNVIETPHDTFGIITSGKAYNDTCQALQNLGLDHKTCQEIGLRLHKVNVVWPLESQLTRQFAEGLNEILVIEEKRQMIEYQIKEVLYHWQSSSRPMVLGKFDDVSGKDTMGGEWSFANPNEHILLRANHDLNPAMIARVIAGRLKKRGLIHNTEIQARINAHLAELDFKEQSMHMLNQHPLKDAIRSPWFCSGCPHNTSTAVPEGSRALAGIGCHIMVTWMDRSTIGQSQMGGEGIPWLGQQPFTTDQHIFANLGDGTYFHSGLLAIRQAVVAKVNITYKILYNDAVAMTGGQPLGETPEGHTVAQIVQSLLAEKVSKLVIVTDEPDKYSDGIIPSHIQVYHRDVLARIQKEFRELKGTSVIIYDQTCATEKRRRRKRGEMPMPTKHIFINELVCEGCGDCGIQSNCLSIEPLETEWGRKRTINQNTCNKDYSCIRGFCPSFVTVEGNIRQKPLKALNHSDAIKQTMPSPFELPELPEPNRPHLTQMVHPVWNIVVAGVGGTGVITIGQLLGMAAHLEGLGIVTQDAAGLAQKGGATWSHIMIAKQQSHIHTTHVDSNTADLILGCDPLVTTQQETLICICQGRTNIVLNQHATPTASFVSHANWKNPHEECAQLLAQLLDTSAIGKFNAHLAATQLMGDSIYANIIMLGYAWQRGWVPLQLVFLKKAIDLNGTNIDQNQEAFEWGRRIAEHCPQTLVLFSQSLTHSEKNATPDLEDMISKRMIFLTDYQNAAYAQRYHDILTQVKMAEKPLKTNKLSLSVARYLFKLMAYKDEYEVARLHLNAHFSKLLQMTFEDNFKLHYHLAPPFLTQKNSREVLQKYKFKGPFITIGFKILTKMKILRGTYFDLFGKTAERKIERQLIDDYIRCIVQILPLLNHDNLCLATEIANIPEQIRGFGHIKSQHLKNARLNWDQLMQQWVNFNNST